MPLAEYIIEPIGAYAVARPTLPPGCPFCHGTGRREMEVGGAIRVGRCRCQRIPDRVATYNAARIPARHAHSTFDSFHAPNPQMEATVKVLRHWVRDWRPDGQQRGVILTGEPGRGKTHLLCAMLRELVFTHGVRVQFVEFTHLLADIRDGYSRNASDGEVLGPVVRVPILGIDELGKGRKTDFELTVIDEIVTRRYNGSGVVLATTNFPQSVARRPRDSTENLALAGGESLADRLGERVFSRLKEMCDIYPVSGDEDYRLTTHRKHRSVREPK